jgi:formylmethanofuran dehydrogenase subunit E
MFSAQHLNHRGERMNIGPYTFEEFKQKVRKFHGYPAPGVLLGGYMVELARSMLPLGTLFDAVVETRKSLPDAVQLLTPLSVGNNGMKIVDLGRWALTFYDKYTRKGCRVFMNPFKLGAWPEMKSWMLKEKAKKAQDPDRLLDEIRLAEASVCSFHSVTVPESVRSKQHLGPVALRPLRSGPYPVNHGTTRCGCQGEAPCELDTPLVTAERRPALRVVSLSK